MFAGRLQRVATQNRKVEMETEKIEKFSNACIASFAKVRPDWSPPHKTIYLDFRFCLGCGKIQGERPRPTTRREKGLCQNVEHGFKSERMYCECAGEGDD